MKRVIHLIAVNAALAALLSVVAFGGLEVYYRLKWTPGPPTVGGYLVEDDVYNHVLAPELTTRRTVHPEVPPFEVRTNALGLRYGRAYAMTKPANTKRIVVCGDSFVEGYAYDTTLPARLEAAFRPDFRSRGHELEVIHAGVSSYSPLIHLIALERKLLPLEPDLVVVAIDPTDARDDHNYGVLLERDADGDPIAVRSMMTTRLESLRRNMSERLPLGDLNRWVARLAPTSYVARAAWHRRALAFAETYTAFVERPPVASPPVPVFFDAERPETAAWIAASIGWVERIHAQLRQRGIPLAIVMYPWREQLDDVRYRRFTRAYEAGARRLGAHFCDATPDFEAATDRDALYLTNDPHFSPAGQALWADSVVRCLRDFAQANAQ